MLSIDFAYSATTLDEKKNRLTKQKSNQTSKMKNECRSSHDLGEINENGREKSPIGRNLIVKDLLSSIYLSHGSSS